MNKRERDIRRMVDRAGLTIKEFHSHKGHYHAVLESPSGRDMNYSFSSTPGDARGDLNCIADLRRFMKGEPPTVVIKRSRLKDPMTLGVPMQVPPPESTTPATPEPPMDEPLTPSPARDPGHRKGTGQILRNVLPHKEFFQLCQYLQKVDLSGVKHATELVEPTQQALGLPLSVSNIRSALETIGRELPKVRKSAKATANEVVLARALLGLYDAVGRRAPQDLITLAELP